MDVQFKLRNNKENLFKAINYNQISEVRRLIESGISVNSKDEDGWTPLMLAAHKNYLNIAKLLVELGADLELKNDDGETALMVSAYNNSGYVARYLISIGANPDDEDKNRRTAYEIAKEFYPNERFDYLLPKTKKIETLTSNSNETNDNITTSKDLRKQFRFGLRYFEEGKDELGENILREIRQNPACPSKLKQKINKILFYIELAQDNDSSKIPSYKEVKGRGGFISTKRWRELF